MPLGPIPTFSLDAASGVLQIDSANPGLFTMGICVAEYKAGTLIDKYRLDYSLAVANCDSDLTARFGYVACGGNATQFVDESQSNPSGFPLDFANYLWDFGDGTTIIDTSTLKNPTWTYPDTGSYVVTLTVNQGLPCEDDTVMVIYVPPIAADSFYITAFGDSLVVSPAAASYQWLYNGNPISGATNQYHIATASGVYSALVTSTSAAGCSDSTDAYIFVGVNDLYLNDQIQLYPNPNRGSFTLRVPFTDEVYMEILDLTGRTVYQTMFQNGVDKSFHLILPKGLYLLKGVNRNTSFTRKLLIF